MGRRTRTASRQTCARGSPRRATRRGRGRAGSHGTTVRSGVTPPPATERRSPEPAEGGRGARKRRLNRIRSAPWRRSPGLGLRTPGNRRVTFARDASTVGRRMRRAPIAHRVCLAPGRRRDSVQQPVFLSGRSRAGDGDRPRRAAPGSARRDREGQRAARDLAPSGRAPAEERRHQRPRRGMQPRTRLPLLHAGQTPTEPRLPLKGNHDCL